MQRRDLRIGGREWKLYFRTLLGSSSARALGVRGPKDAVYGRPGEEAYEVVADIRKQFERKDEIAYSLRIDDYRTLSERGNPISYGFDVDKEFLLVDAIVCEGSLEMTRGSSENIEEVKVNAFHLEKIFPTNDFNEAVKAGELLEEFADLLISRSEPLPMEHSQSITTGRNSAFGR